MITDDVLTNIAYRNQAHSDDVISNLCDRISKLEEEKKHLAEEIKLLAEENNKLTDALWRMKRKYKSERDKA